MAHKNISELFQGEDFEGFYIIRNATVKTSVNGSSFLACQLTDKTGSMEAKCWNYTGPVGTNSKDDGRPVFVIGKAGEYKGTPQISIVTVRFAEENDRYDKTDLVPVAPIDLHEAGRRIREMVNSLDDPDYRLICEAMIEKYGKAFSVWPAAKSVHHGFISGLMMHTYNMLETADFLASRYSGVIDRNLLIAGTLLHDFAKTQEYACSSLGLITDFTVKGQLLGHPVMGAQWVADVSRENGIPEEKSVLLQHMLLSHHGEPEFGAAVVPLLAEADLLHLIDLIDSRMEIYSENMKNMDAGTFSERIFALEKKIYKHKETN